MKERGMPFWDAYNFTRAKRPIICPNMGFMKQLQDFEKELLRDREFQAA
jgi:hypothetical protein